MSTMSHIPHLYNVSRSDGRKSRRSGDLSWPPRRTGMTSTLSRRVDMLVKGGNPMLTMVSSLSRAFCHQTRKSSNIKTRTQSCQQDHMLPKTMERLHFQSPDLLRSFPYQILSSSHDTDENNEHNDLLERGRGTIFQHGVIHLSRTAVGWASWNEIPSASKTYTSTPQLILDKPYL